MLVFVIIAAIVVSAFMTYDFGSSANQSLPSVPNLFGYSQNSLFFGSNSVLSNIQTHNMPSIHASNLFPTPGSTLQNPSSTSASMSTSLAQNSQPVLPPLNPGFATFALCGNDQVVTSYDKTNMATGGDITYITINAPSITADLMFTNGTKITTVQNDKINGCITYDKLPINMMITVLLTGDYSGAMQTSTLTGYILVSCYPDWKQSVAYDPYGNVIQNYNPAIDHPSYCNLNYR